jgi:uncharacterized membrane protein YqaE (UPF0057 family)
MMKRNWIFFAFALLALASCSVEKRVYQPGYHIEWNHFAKQDAEQDVSQDLSKNLSENLETDVAQDVSQGRSEGASQDLPQDLSKNLETDVSQDLSKNLETDVSQGLSKNLETVASQDLSENLSDNLSQKINSDLEFVLLIILALFLPALTVFLVEGFSKNFWIALLLMAVAYLLPISSFVVRGLIVAIATILAIAVVFHYM